MQRLSACRHYYPKYKIFNNPIYFLMNDDIDYDALCALAGADGHDFSDWPWRSIPTTNRRIYYPMASDAVWSSSFMEYFTSHAALHPSPNGRYPYLGKRNL